MYRNIEDEFEVKRTGAKSNIAVEVEDSRRVHKFCPFLCRPVTPGAPLRRQFLNKTDLTVTNSNEKDEDSQFYTVEKNNEKCFNSDKDDGEEEEEEEKYGGCKLREISSRPQSGAAGDGDPEGTIKIKTSNHLINCHENQITSDDRCTDILKDFESWTSIQEEEEEEEEEDDGSILIPEDEEEWEEDKKWDFEDIAADIKQEEEKDNQKCPLLGSLTFQVQDRSVKVAYVPRNFGALKNVPTFPSSMEDPPDTIKDAGVANEPQEYPPQHPQLVASEEQWRRAAAGVAGYPQKFQRRANSAYAYWVQDDSVNGENTLNSHCQQQGCPYPAGGMSSNFYGPSEHPPLPLLSMNPSSGEPPSGEYYDCPRVSSSPAYPNCEGNPFEAYPRASTAYPDFHASPGGMNMNRYPSQNVSTPFQSNSHNHNSFQPGFNNNNIPPPHQNNICIQPPATPGMVTTAGGGGNTIPVNDKAFGQYSNNCNFFIYNMADPSSSPNNNNYGQPPPDYYDAVNCPADHQTYSYPTTTTSILSGPKAVRSMLRPFQRFF